MSAITPLNAIVVTSNPSRFIAPKVETSHEVMPSLKIPLVDMTRIFMLSIATRPSPEAVNREEFSERQLGILVRDATEPSVRVEG